MITSTSKIRKLGTTAEGCADQEGTYTTILIVLLIKLYCDYICNYIAQIN